jgi:hypothetical protein
MAAMMTYKCAAKTMFYQPSVAVFRNEIDDRKRDKASMARSRVD